MNKILVTGAAGYLGIPLVAELVRQKYNVLAIDSDFFKTLYFLTYFDSVTVSRKDYRELTVNDLKNISCVIHLAAIPNDPSGDLFPEKTCMEVNGYGVGNLAKIALDAGCNRFIFMSSCSVYGAKLGTDDWCDEHSPLDPLSSYARAKVYGEEQIKRAQEMGLETVILRGSTLYGMSAIRTRFDLPLNRWCLQAHWSKKVYAVAPCLWRPLITVVDAARAIAAIASAPQRKVSGKLFNLGNTSFNWKLGDVAERVANYFHADLVEVPLGRDSRSYRIRCDRLSETIPDAVPVTSLDAGIAMMEYQLGTGMITYPMGYQPQYNAQNGYKSLLATGELNNNGYRPKNTYGCVQA